MDPLELGANVMTTVSIVLATRNSVHLWWTGILGSALFTYLFFSANLVASANLQVFFIITSVFGWMNWARSKDEPPLPIRRASLNRLGIHVLLAWPVVLFYAALVRAHMDATAPFWDSAALGVSVFAQYLLMGRRLETWPAWLIVNTISVPLYLSAGLRLTAALYAFYWVNAWVGWLRWTREYIGAKRVAQAVTDARTPQSPRVEWLPPA